MFGGVFEEEVGWWEEQWREVMRSEAMERCWEREPEGFVE